MIDMHNPECPASMTAEKAAATMSVWSVALARRAMKLAKDRSYIEMKLIRVGGSVYLQHGDGELERLGPG